MIGSSFTSSSYGDGSSSSSSSASSSSSSFDAFKLKDALKHAPYPETTYQILTKMIDDVALLELDKLEPKLAAYINRALRNVHGYVIDRPYVEGQEDFFTHTAADVIYESTTKTCIKGKNHALKAASHYHSVMNTLTQIKYTMKYWHADPVIIDILLQYQSLFKAHKNALLFALNQLDDAAKARIEKSGLRLSKQRYADLEIGDQQNINKILPTTPSPLKVPLPMKKTPKSLNLAGKRSVTLLMNFSQRLATLTAPAISAPPSGSLSPAAKRPRP